MLEVLLSDLDISFENAAGARKNSPLKSGVIINSSLDRENGRLQMVPVSAPCFLMK